MPKRVVKIKLQARNHRKYRLRTRREIKAYANALVASGKTKRRGTKHILKNIRGDQAYWNKLHTMDLYFVAKRIQHVVREMEEDDQANNERFALRA